MALEIKQLLPEHQQALAELFASVAQDGERFFHPHPMTEESAQRICHSSGADLYYVVLDGEEALAYGMLRGWDKGYEVPSLGIVVKPSARGAKLGEMLMHFLHSAARRKRARSVRLKVYEENAAALSLYRKMGYEFTEKDETGQQIGRLQL